MGIITNIQRFSTEDGPGVRTTVFLKGCNLDCFWCHNPETKSPYPQQQVLRGRASLCGEEWSAGQICDAVRRDLPFYRRSGGGVTFSGGEPLLQPDFLLDCLQRCREVGIHTAVDTAGNVPWDYFERVAPYTDLFLYDIKLIDDDLHRRYTGVSNRRIIENLGKLGDVEAEVTVRTLLLPGINDNQAAYEAFAAFLSKYPFVKQVDVLPYHAMGEP